MVPLRRVLRSCEVTHRPGDGDRPRSQVARVIAAAGATAARPRRTTHIVMAPGSISRTLPIPGLAEWASGSSTSRRPSSCATTCSSSSTSRSRPTTSDPRARALNFVFVGGGYAGVEALAELEDMARYATRYYRGHLARATCAGCWSRRPGGSCPRSARTWAATPWSSCASAASTCGSNTRLESCVDGHVVLSDGDGVRRRDAGLDGGGQGEPGARRHRPAAGREGPGQGRRHDLQVEGADDAWAAGDCAAVPDLTSAQGEFTAPNAQHAVRQAKVARRQHRPGAARRSAADGLPAQVRRLGGQPRPAQGRRAGVRHQAARACRRGSCTGRTT